jgi:hypothetical protein
VRVLDEANRFLGHAISEKGISVNPSKIRDILSWDVPASIADIHSLLGLVGYYRKFIKGFSKITKPIIELLGRIRSSRRCPHVKLVLGIEEATNHFLSVSDA